MTMTTNTLPAISAVDAVSPSPRVSPRYRFVPTGEYISAMESNGWEVESQRDVKTRNPAEQPYAKHLVTMRKRGELARNIALGGLQSRFHLVNSHNGSSSVQGFLGMFRMICSNGIIIGSSLMQEFRFAHTLRAKTVADTITDTFLTSHDNAIRTAERWASIQLTHEQCVSLCHTAAELRGLGSAHLLGPVNEQSVLSLQVARRPADRGADLWSTFNRIQESVMQGGFQLAGAKARARKVTAIAATVRLNRLLWDAAEKIASPNLVPTYGIALNATP